MTATSVTIEPGTRPAAPKRVGSATPLAAPGSVRTGRRSPEPQLGCPCRSRRAICREPKQILLADDHALLRQGRVGRRGPAIVILRPRGANLGLTVWPVPKRDSEAIVVMGVSG